jgi:DNA-binding transcriptional regulator/RsmH inhibitor MraZ
MDRDELAEIYWAAYQEAAIKRHNCDVGEYDELEIWDQESQKDALEAVQNAILLGVSNAS